MPVEQVTSMYSESKSERVASVLVVYDWEGKLDRQAWVDLGLRFFERIGRVPNSADYVRDNGKSGKVKPNNLLTSILNKEIIAAGLSRLLPPFKDMNHYSDQCGFHDSGGRDRVIYFCYENNALDAKLFIDLVVSVASIVRPTYGIGVQWSFKRGPAFFPYNIVYGDQSQEEADQWALWRAERTDMIIQRKLAPFRHLHGWLRDVYPFNVLSEYHLRQMVGGVTFRVWIESAAGKRGHLLEVVQGTWVWTAASNQIADIRKVLQATGLLISRPAENLGLTSGRA